MTCDFGKISANQDRTVRSMGTKCLEATDPTAARTGLLSQNFNLYAPRFLYIGQAFRYSSETAFYIFNQQILVYFII